MDPVNLENFREDYDPPDDGARFHGPHGEPIYLSDLIDELDQGWKPC